MVHLDTHIRTLESEFRSLLKTKHLGQMLRFMESTDSTNSRAMEWAQEGADEGALVLAEHQTAGRGRHGRAWETVSSSNLLFSIVLRPQLSPSALSLLTISASIALSETIDHFLASIPTQIKWPNDVLINGKKCCGMLLETIISNKKNRAALPVVLGIGVNLNQEVFSNSIAHKTTSLLLESGRHMPRMAFLAHFLSSFEEYYFALTPDNNDGLLASYQRKLAYLNEERTLRFMGRDEEITGIIRGITATGALKMQTESGLVEFHAGEVTSQDSRL